MSTVISKFVHERIQSGVALHSQLQDSANALSTLTPQAEQLRHTANALWQAIEVQYSTQTDRDVVPVAWMHMALPRSEWRHRLSVLDREATTVEHERAEFQTQRDSLKSQLTSLQHDTVVQLRQLYAAQSELPATTVEYLTQVHAQHFAAAISDWDGAIKANASAQKLMPSIELAGQGILFQAFLQVQDIASNAGNLDKTMALLESILPQRKATTLTPVQTTTLLQAQHLHAALFAAKAPQIQATQGSKAFVAQFNQLKDGIIQFEKRIASPEYRDATASAHLQLVRVLWAAHRYQDAFAEAARIQRTYADTSAASELQAPQCWLYRARPEAYAPGGLIRENLSEISFSGIGAAAREAWAHTNENSAVVQYGLPVLGCIAGATVASKLGAAAGTAVGPEGTVLGFGAGAATGCGIGAAAGKVVDWAASAITAPEVAQSFLTSVSDETLGMTWARLNFAALELATTYYLGKSLWSPALGLAQGGVDVGAGIYKVGRYTITQPVAALADVGGGILTTARVSGAIAQTFAQHALNPAVATKVSIAAIRANAAEFIEVLRNISMDSYAHAVSVAASIGIAGLAMYPSAADATPAGETPKTKIDLLWNAIAKPGIAQWTVSIPVFFFGIMSTARVFWLDRLLVQPKVWAAFRNETRAQAILGVLEKSHVNLGAAALQAVLVNTPWLYWQAEANNVEPLLMALGSFSDVGYVLGGTLSRSIVYRTYKADMIARYGVQTLTRQAKNPVANFLRNEGIFGAKIDLKTIIPRYYLPFFGYYLIAAQLNNQTFGRIFTDAEAIPWFKRNMAQPLPMFIRKALVSVPFNIDTKLGIMLDWWVNYAENKMLSWFFPPWAGRKNWHDDFVKFDEGTPWDTMMTHYESKMEYGGFQIPHGSIVDTLSQTAEDLVRMFTFRLPNGTEKPSIFGQRMMPSEYADFYNDMVAGDLGPTKALDSVMVTILVKAEPERFTRLPDKEKRRVLVHLAMINKAAQLSDAKIPAEKRAQLDRLTTQSQRALAPHLKSLGFNSVDEMSKIPMKELVERINDL